MTVEMFYCPQSLSANPLTPDYSNQKIYADVPLRFFNNIDDLKKYVLELKNIGVNVLLILPHFKPSLSPYVVKNYEQPCELFGDWKNFAEFMKFVENLGMDRMIDIPFNHADWQADNLKREWFKDYENDGIEAGADDVDADNNRVRINWGAFILDNSLAELQNYWLEKVIFPHIEKYHVNSIRIDAAWGLDPNGLKRIISATKKRYPHVWFLAENLGMAPLIELAESGIEAGADRFFNNMYWYSGGLYIPADIYKLYKRSNALPTCSIFSSHDTLMPAMKALAKIRSDEVKGLNDKAIVRKFVEYEWSWR
jgi:glycosidase